MYGMINNAIEIMVKEIFDENTWNEICDEINYEKKSFDLFHQYDDKLTLDLVLVICKKTQKEPKEFLDSFGVYWVSYTFNTEYRELLNTFATSPIELINSLNNLHDRLEMSFKELMPPTFDIVDVSQNTITVNYYSERSMPLEYFVIGVFKGIFKHFDKECEIEMVENPLGNAKATIKIKHNE